jgi:hypothetical protein
MLRSCSTTSRPPRPTGSPVRSASEAAITPPAQITVRVTSTVPSLSTTLSGVTSTTPVPRCSRTPLALQDLRRVVVRAVGERAEQGVRVVDQVDAGRAHGQAAVLVRQHVLDQLGQGPGHLDPGRPAADHDEPDHPRSTLTSTSSWCRIKVRSELATSERASPAVATW